MYVVGVFKHHQLVRKMVGTYIEEMRLASSSSILVNILYLGNLAKRKHAGGNCATQNVIENCIIFDIFAKASLFFNSPQLPPTACQPWSWRWTSLACLAAPSSSPPAASPLCKTTLSLASNSWPNKVTSKLRWDFHFWKLVTLSITMSQSPLSQPCFSIRALAQHINYSSQVLGKSCIQKFKGSSGSLVSSLGELPREFLVCAPQTSPNLPRPGDTLPTADCRLGFACPFPGKLSHRGHPIVSSPVFPPVYPPPVSSPCILLHTTRVSAFLNPSQNVFRTCTSAKTIKVACAAFSPTGQGFKMHNCLRT